MIAGNANVSQADFKNPDFKNPAVKNNVTRFLDSRRVRYQLFTFDYDAGVDSAVRVAEAIGLPPVQVFKTLVVQPEDPNRKPLLVIIPGPDTLDLKTLAKAATLKKVKMATHEQAEALTGLQTGGISPLALINKGFDIYLDAQAQAFDAIAISAGQRGVNVLVSVKELVQLTRARIVRLKP
jgi:Cys-tRNA(Pro)/Cys-tRNA(Cys) deacylase